MTIVRSRAFSRSMFFAHGSLVEGEDKAAFDDLYDQLFDAIRPNDLIDEMYIADIVAEEWELLRWRRIKSATLSRLRSRVLRSFLEESIDYLHFQENFQEGLEAILREHLNEEDAEEHAGKLALGCAQYDSEAIETVREILSGTGRDFDKILKEAREARANEIVKLYRRHEPKAVELVDKLLADAATTIDDLVADGLEGDLETIERVDQMITINERRRSASLHEIDRRRSHLGEALRRSIQQIEQDESRMIETAPTGGTDAA
jgi:hypothetical protein